MSSGGHTTTGEVVLWSSLDDIAADLAARLNHLLDVLDHYHLEQIPHGTIPGWRDFAACKQTYHPAFFPDDIRKGKRSLKQAQGWCDCCAVRTECLEYAIRNNIREGVWGGKTYHQRTKRR